MWKKFDERYLGITQLPQIESRRREEEPAIMQLDAKIPVLIDQFNLGLEIYSILLVSIALPKLVAVCHSYYPFI